MFGDIRLAVGAVVVPWGRMSRRTWGWLTLYAVLAGALFAAAAWALWGERDALIDAAARLILPEAWRPFAASGVEAFFRGPLRSLVGSLAVFSALTLASLTLFPVKEALGQSYERDRARALGLPDPKSVWKEEGFWEVAWDEVSWAGVGIAGWLLLAWAGYGPSEPWREAVVAGLGYGWLFVTLAGDFVTPVFQRRARGYAAFWGLLLRRPLALLGLGALLGVPGLIAAELGGPEWMLGVVFGVSVLAVTVAVVAGGEVGAALVPAMEAVRPWPMGVRWVAGLGVVAVLAGAGWLGSRLGASVLAKSQILKCHYSVAWSDVELRGPGLGALARGELEVGVSVPVTIVNPTPLPVRIEASRLVVTEDGHTVAEGRVEPFGVPAEGEAKVAADLTLGVELTTLLQGVGLRPDRWSVTLWVALDEGLEWPIFIR